MNLIELSIFPTPVQVIENFLTEEDRIKIKEFILHKRTSASDNTFIHDTLTNKSSSTGQGEHTEKLIQEINDISDGFEDNMHNILQNYSNTTWGVKIKLMNSWFNIQTKGSHLLKHLHPNSFISAALYVEVDNDSSPLIFYNPVIGAQMNASKFDSIYSNNAFKIKPENGMLVIFPSWVEHGSGNFTNESEQRIVLSVNTQSVSPSSDYGYGK